MKFPKIKKDQVVRFLVLVIRLNKWLNKKTGISLKDCWRDAKISHRHQTCFFPVGNLEDVMIEEQIERRNKPREHFPGLEKVKKAIKSGKKRELIPESLRKVLPR